MINRFAGKDTSARMGKIGAWGSEFDDEHKVVFEKVAGACLTPSHMSGEEDGG